MPKVTMRQDWRGHREGDSFEATEADVVTLQNYDDAPEFDVEPLPGEEEYVAAQAEAAEAKAAQEQAEAKATEAKRQLTDKQQAAEKKANSRRRSKAERMTPE